MAEWWEGYPSQSLCVERRDPHALAPSGVAAFGVPGGWLLGLLFHERSRTVG